MSIRHAEWFRELEHTLPTWRVTCHKCGESALVAQVNRGAWKVAHQHQRHFGHPMDFGQKQEDGGTQGKGAAK